MDRYEIGTFGILAAISAEKPELVCENPDVCYQGNFIQVFRVIIFSANILQYQPAIFKRTTMAMREQAARVRLIIRITGMGTISTSIFSSLIRR